MKTYLVSMEQIKTGKEKLLPILSGIVISLLIALTWIQVSYWKNSITLFKHAINVTDTKYLGVATIHAFLGDAYHREGELGDHFGCVTPEEAFRSHQLFQAALDSQRLNQTISL